MMNGYDDNGCFVSDEGTLEYIQDNPPKLVSISIQGCNESDCFGLDSEDLQEVLVNKSPGQIAEFLGKNPKSKRVVEKVETRLLIG